MDFQQIIRERGYVCLTVASTFTGPFSSVLKMLPTKQANGLQQRQSKPFQNPMQVRKASL